MKCDDISIISLGYDMNSTFSSGLDCIFVYAIENASPTVSK